MRGECIFIVKFSVADPFHFNANPGPKPRIRFRDDGSGSGLLRFLKRIRIRIHNTGLIDYSNPVPGAGGWRRCPPGS